MPYNPLIGSTVYWNMTTEDYCMFHSIWQNFQPYVRTTLRPSKQEGKVVVAFNLHDIQSVGLFVEARVMLRIPAEEGTDVIIKHNNTLQT